MGIVSFGTVARTNLIPCNHRVEFYIQGKKQINSDNKYKRVKKQYKRIISCCAGDVLPSVDLEKEKGNDLQQGGMNGQHLMMLALGALLCGGVGMFMFSSQGAQLNQVLRESILGKSGFLAAFSLIFLAEIGDKTFFIAALLAMKLGKWVSLIGSTSSLAVMTVISVVIGQIFKNVPHALTTSLPIGEWLGTILLVIFGIKSLMEGLKAEDEEEEDDGELREAQRSLSEAGRKSAGERNGTRL
eukprot:TRINITY_DN5571_c1_g1_i4.p1 TRINITY_DN5571_c1_g1~~TRINITY_DN5571_c1_g1_i4.p1  ORF type:complete len:243 (-),score=26.81 TRINITY_DN5571_c1_g1_i4:52-780(-)